VRTRVAFQFVTEADPVSGMIRWFSHAAVSHVDMVLEDGSLFGAHLVGGVKRRAPDYAPWSRVVRVELMTPKAEAVIAAALSQDGKPYDWRAILAFAFDRDWRACESWTCSELQAWALERGGFFLQPLILPASRITPGDLLFLTAAMGEVTSDRRAP
jgi:hypothetical protein